MKTKQIHRKKLRKSGWDYSRPAIYFLTICTKNRCPYFGKIKEGNFIYSPIGTTAFICWQEIANHFSGFITWEFVVMPDHIHALCEIKPNCNTKTQRSVGVGHDPPLQNGNCTDKKRISLPTIIGCYKSAVSKYAHQMGFEFAWQRSFYDIIVKDDIAFSNIKSYIRNNPKQWKEDRFNVRFD
jgi:REP element-mobilizing transposase RayT